QRLRLSAGRERRHRLPASIASLGALGPADDGNGVTRLTASTRHAPACICFIVTLGSWREGVGVPDCSYCGVPGSGGFRGHQSGRAGLMPMATTSTITD